MLYFLAFSGMEFLRGCELWNTMLCLALWGTIGGCYAFSRYVAVSIEVRNCAGR